MPDLSTPEERAEVLRALYDWGVFVPTIFLLGPVGDEEPHLEGRFCLNDEAVAAVIGKWWKPPATVEMVCEECGSVGWFREDDLDDEYTAHVLDAHAPSVRYRRPGRQP